MNKTLRKNLRRFHWISSLENGPELAELERKLGEYYSSDRVRELYEPLCEAARDSQPEALNGLMDAILAEQPRAVLEVGCGSGWILERLMARGLSEESYHGTEMSSSQIDANRQHFPLAQWHVANGYSLPFEANRFDIAFCYCVIEHCVYPERLLREMTRVLRPGGILLLVFPDMVAAGLLPSQVLGKHDGTAKQLVSRGAFISALTSLYDSRVRLRGALAKVHERVGPFPINLKPRCLYEDRVELPDADAVYIGSKREIIQWATAEGHGCDLPNGEEGPLASAAFVRVRKSQQ